MIIQSGHTLQVSSSNLKFKRRTLIILIAGPAALPYVPSTYVPSTYVPMTLNIPRENCLFPAEVSPAMKEASKCHFLLHNVPMNPEYVGCDPLLNASADEITRFFLTHLQKPIVYAQIEGKRVERYTDEGKPVLATDFV